LIQRLRAEQVRAVSIDRLGELIGQTSESIMTSLDQALRRHLAL
jgi:mRNA-degrading endonuclease toxin of MazEF toxin-antitoxin module